MTRNPVLLCLERVLFLGLATVVPAFAAARPGESFRAGAAAVNISPPAYPVRVNGMFTERSANSILDPLFARSVALDDGETQIIFCVVDTCMVPRELIDRAKEETLRKTGLSTARMMVSATHTHSAPAAMGCLGTRMDPHYAEWLPGKIAECMIKALDGLQPARIGWASIDDWEHTYNRRWISRLDRTGTDPFGLRNIHANMHPGHLSPNVIGPSGPVDPELSLFAVQTPGGRPLALFANYSQHYYGSGLLSADYFGAFCRHMANNLGQPSSEGPFVAMISQGTSGDLMWMDYGSARGSQTMEQYSAEVAQYAMRAYGAIQWHDHLKLGMVEQKLVLDWRRPGEQRLAWARDRMTRLQGALPRTRQDIYAMEASILHESPKAELKLQSIRIGGLGIATLPNEVYALTGLKLKALSPFDSQLNIELANGAEGYIPPREQFSLGGYTTWPARTAGLEISSESQIVTSLLAGLEQVAGRARKTEVLSSRAYRGTGVQAHWPLDDLGGDTAKANGGHNHPALRIGGKVARYLPGVGSGSGCGNERVLTPSPLAASGTINRAMHLVDGHLESEMPLPRDFTVALWYWLGERSGASAREGTLLRLPSGQVVTVKQDAFHRCRITLDGMMSEETQRADEWNFAVLTCSAGLLQLHVNGTGAGGLRATLRDSRHLALRFGEGLEGKLDEIAIWNRALSEGERNALWERSGLADQRTRDGLDAVRRARLPVWPARYRKFISQKTHLFHAPFDTAPREMIIEQAVRFSDRERARFKSGRISGQAESLASDYSVSFWFRNDLPNQSRPVTAYLFSRGPKDHKLAPGDHLGIGGNYRSTYPGRLLLFNGNEADDVLIGKTVIPPGSWNHAVLARSGTRARAWLNGALEIDGILKPTAPDSPDFHIGARNDFFAPLEGYLAEFLLLEGALSEAGVKELHAAARPDNPEHAE